MAELYVQKTFWLADLNWVKSSIKPTVCHIFRGSVLERWQARALLSPHLGSATNLERSSICHIFPCLYFKKIWLTRLWSTLHLVWTHFPCLCLRNMWQTLVSDQEYLVSASHWEHTKNIAIASTVFVLAVFLRSCKNEVDQLHYEKHSTLTQKILLLITLPTYTVPANIGIIITSLYLHSRQLISWG